MVSETSIQTKIVCNSSPIINLAKIDRLDLLEKLFKNIIIPFAVYEEVVIQGANKKGVDKIQRLIEKNIISVKKVTNRSFVKALSKDLDMRKMILY